jgi:hypothetical protein
MKTNFNKIPREFTFKNVTLKDLGKIYLEDNELVSFVTKSGGECDFAAKSWGFYVCPSVNGRLKNEGFKTAITCSKEKRVYVLVVATDKIQEFKNYLNDQQGKLICWLDEWMEPEY